MGWRTERFVFGGEDGVLSEEEIGIATVYKGLLTERLWKYRKEARTKLPNWVIVYTFDDVDLQRLLLEEREEYKGIVTYSLQGYKHLKGRYPNVASRLSVHLLPTKFS